MKNNPRWEQRFYNFSIAIDYLEQSVYAIQMDDASKELMQDVLLAEMIKVGLIHQFEYTHDLACNLMKDYIEHKEKNIITEIKDTTHKAFKLKLIFNEEVWMDMLASRNKIAQPYNEETADEVYNKIIEEYTSEVQKFRNSEVLNPDSYLDGSSEVRKIRNSEV